jgi:hypothetical protein
MTRGTEAPPKEGLFLSEERYGINERNPTNFFPETWVPI